MSVNFTIWAVLAVGYFTAIAMSFGKARVSTMGRRITGAALAIAFAAAQIMLAIIEHEPINALCWCVTLVLATAVLVMNIRLRRVVARATRGTCRPEYR